MRKQSIDTGENKKEMQNKNYGHSPERGHSY